MKEREFKHRILILGASGFIGNAIYRELCGYFKTFGTYNIPRKEFENNQHFFQYNHETDDIYEILEALKPSIIISTLRGDFGSQVLAHRHICEYISVHTCKLIFLSSANVFDAYSKYPSYEYDKTLSHSTYGHFKIKIENMLLRMPKRKVAILRLPMIFGIQSPRVNELKMLLKDKQPIEVFPNIVMNVSTDSKITQQIHYIINRDKYGIFHLGSTDLVHHDDFIEELVSVLGNYNPIYKQVFTANEKRYLAVLPKDNKLPKNLQLVSQDIVTELQV